MKKNINEASVNMTISDLTSSDLDTLSRMLALAGQAECSSNEINDSVSSPFSDDVTELTPPLNGAGIEGELASDDSFSLVQDDLGADMSKFNLENSDGLNGMDDMDSIFENLTRMSQLSGIKLTESEEEEADESSDEDESIVSEAGLVGRATSAVAGAKTGANLGKFLGPEGAVAGAAIGGYAGWQSGANDEVDESVISEEEHDQLINRYSTALNAKDQALATDNPMSAIPDNQPDDFELGFSLIPDVQPQEEIPTEFGNVSDFRNTLNSLNSLETQEVPSTSGSIEVVVDGPTLDSNDIYGLRQNGQFAEAVEDPEDEDSEQFVQESAMFNFALDEDTVNELGSPGLGDNRVFGPYKNKVEAINDARKETTGGVEGVDFDFQIKPEGVYWVKLNKLNEDASNRTEQDDVDPSSFKGDKNANLDKEIQKDGDNGLVESWNYRDLVERLESLNKE